MSNPPKSLSIFLSLHLFEQFLRNANPQLSPRGLPENMNFWLRAYSRGKAYFKVWHFTEKVDIKHGSRSQSTKLKNYRCQFCKQNLLVNNDLFIITTKAMFPFLLCRVKGSNTVWQVCQSQIHRGPKKQIGYNPRAGLIQCLLKHIEMIARSLLKQDLTLCIILMIK